MSDIRDFTGKNRKFTGTNSIRLPNGTTAQRIGSEAGEIRFNTTLNLAEYYTGTEWKAIDAPPIINTIAVDGGADAATGFISAAAGGNATVVIKGSLFDTTGATVTFVGTSETISTESITRNSSTQLTVTVARASFDNANEPYAVRVTNGSGLFAELSSAIYQDAAPVFATAADTTVASIWEGKSAPFSETTVAATDADSDTITYSISAGALPPGVTINSSTGALAGTVSGSSIQNYTFTVSAATTLQTTTRQFIVAVIANPNIAATGGTITTDGDFKVHTFTSPGTFTVTNAGTPSGATTVEYLIVGGGAAGGQGCGSGGGGAGGYRTNYPAPGPNGGQPITATDYPVSVGGGGSGAGDQATPNVGPSGSTSSVFSITSAGGGGGAGNSGTPPTGNPGGSGGGGGHGLGGGGSGNQPPVTPPQGNPGGQSTPQGYTSDDQGGGGGGASQAGIGPTGFGGAGSPNAISGSAVTYAGGGGGGHRDSPNTGLFAEGGAGGGGRGGGKDTGATNCRGRPATVNTGGGGGGACRITNSPPSGFGSQGSGGSGIVIIRYKYQ